MSQYYSKFKNIEGIKISNILNSNTRKDFNLLKQPFILILIFQHFDDEYYIQIKIDILG